MTEKTIEPRYTARYGEALAYAVELHKTQARKMVEEPPHPVPYAVHLLEASALVWHAGGDEDLAIAALLHDALEDQWQPDLDAEIVALFGDRVLEVVRGCTDGSPDQVRDASTWKERKERYIAHVADATDDVRLVSLCDKVSNAEAMVNNLLDGQPVWNLFNASRTETLWYYESLYDAFVQSGTDDRMLARFGRAVDTIATFVTCPECGEPTVTPIQWGLPLNEPPSGVIIGGCIPPRGEWPSWVCMSCDVQGQVGTVDLVVLEQHEIDSAAFGTDDVEPSGAHG